jgi:hypothetical protein
MSEKTYEIVEEGTGIVCLICGMVSYNREDVRRRFCGSCKVFHDDVAKKADEVEECQKDISGTSGIKSKGGKEPPPAKCLATKLGQRKSCGRGLRNHSLGSHFTRRRLY